MEGTVLAALKSSDCTRKISSFGTVVWHWKRLLERMGYLHPHRQSRLGTRKSHSWHDVTLSITLCWGKICTRPSTGPFSQYSWPTDSLSTRVGNFFIPPMVIPAEAVLPAAQTLPQVLPMPNTTYKLFTGSNLPAKNALEKDTATKVQV